MVVLKPDSKIVIGLDFGTTYSGGAWARSGQPDNIETVTDWESQLSRNSDREKAPTLLQFDESMDFDSNLKSWGYNVPTNVTPLKWFKLLLIERNDLPREVRESRQLEEARVLLRKANKSPIEAVAAYLGVLWNHVIEGVIRSAGRALLNISKLEVVITLPAIWPHYAQKRMRDAADAAGILAYRAAGETTLRFIPEPEAAALATLADLNNRPDIQEGNHFVVCDAGGGTVDIITYEVIQANPLVVRESVRGDGKLCGAIFLDEGFIELMERKLGKAKWASFSPEAVTKFMNNEWEHGIKTQFDDTSGIAWNVQLPAVNRSMPGFQCTELRLTRDEVRSVFKPVATQVEELITEQIRQVKNKYQKEPKYVILVGGFGRCKYLYNLLRNSSQISAIAANIDILQGKGDRPWTAICRGAVIRGLTAINSGPASLAVRSRVARSSYGVRCSHPFVHGVDDERDMYWNEQECRHSAHSVTWFLDVGSDVSETKPVTHEFYRLFDEVLDQWRTISEELHISTASTPPTRPDSTVKTLCSISWKKIPPLNTFPIWTNPMGKQFRKVTFTIEMTSDGASLDFTIINGGEKLAAQNVQVDY